MNIKNLFCLEPYTNWYIIKKNDEKVGSIYLSKRDEIGVSILKKNEFDEIAKNFIQIINGAKSTKTLSR